MCGRIELESELGKGSVFRATLTLDIAGGVPEKLVPVDGKLIATSKILAVDDNALANDIIADQLTPMGASVTCVSSAVQALDELKSAANNDVPYDAVITDYCMPEINGEMLAKLIRLEKTIPETPVILATSAPLDEGSKKLKRAGFAGYLLKPLFPDEVSSVIAVILDASRTGRDIPLVTRHNIAGNLPLKLEKRLFENKDILLVEDNPVNKMIASTILEKAGCIVNSAVNGLEALTVFKRQEFDLIFMDCQMPEMDGLEASSEIRKYELDHQLARTPIIAFTANAMDGDRQKCIAAGMDDYVSKPVVPDSMERMLAKWLPDNAADQAIDYEILENLQMVTNGHHIEILKLFLEISAEVVPEIAEAAKARDAKSLKHKCHYFKSPSQQIGATTLTELIRQLENFAIDGNLVGIDPILNNFIAHAKIVTRDLMQYIENNEASPDITKKCSII